MRPVPLAAVVTVVLALCIAEAEAQPVIHRTALDAETGVLTITGTGLGTELTVLIEGQPTTVLPGATETQFEVQAPASMLGSPGAYRLVVLDPTRRAGDAFVVTSGVSGRHQPSALRSEGARATRPASSARTGVRAGAAGESMALPPTTVSPFVIENTLNTAVGVGALASNTTGFNNAAVGVQALGANTLGSSNTAMGNGALRTNTTGTHNTATGNTALFSNTTGFHNTAAGHEALARNTSGFWNTAAGSWTLNFNTTGSANTASGMEALFSNTTGTNNTATGTFALLWNTTGHDNTAAGFEALTLNTSGLYNTAGGSGALRANATGNNNVATGAESLYTNAAGHDNVAAGTSALYHATTSFNAALGTGALYNVTTGGSNTAVGDRAGSNATTGSYNVFVGAGAMGTAVDANTIRLGTPFDPNASGGPSGQNRTFIAGIHGTVLTGPAVQVFVDANGQLGTLTAPPITGTIGAPMSSAPAPDPALQRQVEAQAARIAALEARLRHLEGLLKGR